MAVILGICIPGSGTNLGRFWAVLTRLCWPGLLPSCVSVTCHLGFSLASFFICVLMGIPQLTWDSLFLSQGTEIPPYPLLPSYGLICSLLTNQKIMGSKLLSQETIHNNDNTQISELRSQHWSLQCTKTFHSNNIRTDGQSKDKRWRKLTWVSQAPLQIKLITNK